MDKKELDLTLGIKDIASSSEKFGFQLKNRGNGRGHGSIRLGPKTRGGNPNIHLW
jgi:hypothetical protein